MHSHTLGYRGTGRKCLLNTGNINGKFQHGGKIPAVGIGKWQEKIPVWSEISPGGDKTSSGAWKL
jgi:hypothetical protein